MRRPPLGLAGVLLLMAAACTDVHPAPDARPSAPPPQAAAPAPAPPAAATPAQPSKLSEEAVLLQLLAVEPLARKMAAEIYKPEVSGVRSMVGGEKASQVEKAEETFREVYEKELRRAAHRLGLTYEEALARVERHRPRTTR